MHKFLFVLYCLAAAPVYATDWANGLASYDSFQIVFDYNWTKTLQPTGCQEYSVTWHPGGRVYNPRVTYRINNEILSSKVIEKIRYSLTDSSASRNWSDWDDDIRDGKTFSWAGDGLNSSRTTYAFEVCTRAAPIPIIGPLRAAGGSTARGEEEFLLLEWESDYSRPGSSPVTRDKTHFKAFYSPAVWQPAISITPTAIQGMSAVGTPFAADVDVTWDIGLVGSVPASVDLSNAELWRITRLSYQYKGDGKIRLRPRLNQVSDYVELMNGETADSETYQWLNVSARGPRHTIPLKLEVIPAGAGGGVVNGILNVTIETV
ncbi:hypothetical protein RCM09_19860 [Escherichia marmotae]|uniref:hypothetical protein n=1 Tax=Escherichia TaxID=561 RepID=UPI000CF76617|nr:MULTISPECIES: hypothetical protein [Escherichia]MDE9782866.1 hypothetical protein [Escherichia marmotae]MEC9636682.1 hypothetical protein [Escherichia marmotae]MEC9721573.1 hypothetical protein [Escherichia marmotae]MEC9945050.1 hypothetical protein [Escherichia marmotae]MEC9948406.1 hypothetical protein [Escherichia marmotae]